MYKTFAIHSGDKINFSTIVESETRKQAARDRNNLLSQKDGSQNRFRSAVTTFPGGKVVSQSIVCAVS